METVMIMSMDIIIAVTLQNNKNNLKCNSM